MNKPLIAITMGDPCGVGPEIIVAALTDPAIRAACKPLVLGDRRAMQRALAVCKSTLELVTVTSPAEAPICRTASFPCWNYPVWLMLISPTASLQNWLAMRSTAISAAQPSCA
jgi:4-hydroxy-L-threonine phosphate dehydrogenase PdxA